MASVDDGSSENINTGLKAQAESYVDFRVQPAKLIEAEFDKGKFEISYLQQKITQRTRPHLLFNSPM